MEGVKYLVIVTRREFAEDYTEFLGRVGAQSVSRTFCKGTATDHVLSVLGIEKTENVMFRSVVAESVAEKIRKGLKTEMNIDGLGNGICLTLPLDGIGGEYSKNYLLGDKPIEKQESKMEEKSKFVLIIAIADRGNSELVMDAARSAGATGGTVLSAKGTGAKIAKFFGVVISEEKEMVHVVARRESRDAIMKAIMEKAGSDTPAHGVVFSLPVEQVDGIRSFAD
ncbi:MAG: P-II family nitrogen regulator [Clostridia bacterium]|nr:P-II family nitrogen regulator [Clostridia bacterium]